MCKRSRAQTVFSSHLVLVFFLFLTNNAVADVVSKPLSAAGITVKATVESVRKTVIDGQSLTAAVLDKKLRDIIAPVFDFREMSRRCLGANWKKGTPDQRKEFIELFSDMLARNYLKKIRENAKDSEFSLLSEKTNGKKAKVRTNVTYDGQDVSIEYRLRNKKNAWRVYDVIIENIGLVSNYRSEFSGIVKNEKFDGLLRRLRAKKI